MNNKYIKRTLKGLGLAMLLLVVVLGVHIYIVTRPKAPDANAMVMARIDLHKTLTSAESDKISSWLYGQAGVDHVLCNPYTGIAVFTFMPSKANADEILKALRNEFELSEAVRYQPSADELSKGCPVAANSVSYKAYKLIKHLF